MKRACVITEELDRERVGVPNGTRLVDNEIRIGDLVKSGTRQTFFVETQILCPSRIAARSAKLDHSSGAKVCMVPYP